MGDFTENKGAGGLGEGMSEDLCMEPVELNGPSLSGPQWVAGAEGTGSSLSFSYGSQPFRLSFGSE